MVDNGLPTQLPIMVNYVSLPLLSWFTKAASLLLEVFEVKGNSVAVYSKPCRNSEMSFVEVCMLLWHLGDSNTVENSLTDL